MEENVLFNIIQSFYLNNADPNFFFIKLLHPPK